MKLLFFVEIIPKKIIIGMRLFERGEMMKLNINNDASSFGNEMRGDLRILCGRRL
jgi:hypothetical protein